MITLHITIAFILTRSFLIDIILMLKNLKWATGALKKVPSFFRMEVQSIEFQVAEGFFSLRDLQGSQEVVSTGTSINFVTVTKRGLGKTSTLKQLVSAGENCLVAKYQELFDFKASLFYETNGNCIPKVLRLNINRVCRVGDSAEYTISLLGYVSIALNEVPNTGQNIFTFPLVLINPKAITGKMTVKLNMFEKKSDFDMDDDVSISSIGSNLSFMQKENVGRGGVGGSGQRSVGGQMQEAGMPSRFQRTTPAEVEALLAEVAIVKMHLDKALADKASVESQRKDETLELSRLRLEKAEFVDKLKAKDQTIIELQHNNDILCKALQKLQITLVAKGKELNLLKQERVIYLRNDRILDIKDKTELLHELTKTTDVIVAPSGGQPMTEGTRSVEEGSDLDSTETKNSRISLFKQDEVDTTLRRNAPKAILFNDDVVELLRDFGFPPEQQRSKSAPVRRSGSGRPSLFESDDHEKNMASATS